VEAGLFPNPPTAGQDKKFPSTGVGLEWHVQAGPLQIRIDCDFALTEANLKNSKGVLKQIDDDTILNSKAGIFSTPMHSKIDSSILNITITDSANTIVDGFSAHLVMKAAAKALWSEYRAEEDPLLPNSRRPDTLRKGDDPTMQLCQGVRIYPPKPKLGKTTIVELDATLAMKSRIESNTGAPWLFPTPEPEQIAFIGTLFEPSATPEAQWADFKPAWTAPKDAAGNVLADVRGDNGAKTGMLPFCADVLGWTARPPEEKVQGITVPDVNGRMPWELRSEPPPALVAGLDEYYPELPMVTVA
jgi:hypothetical protein